MTSSKESIAYPPFGYFDLIFLGTGNSACVPNLSCLLRKEGKCKGVCEDAHSSFESKNRRNNVSIIIRFKDKDGKEQAIQVDCGKTFRDGALRFFSKFQIDHISALLLTHDHADALLGLDDLRDTQESHSIYDEDTMSDIYVIERPIPIYCSLETEKVFKKVFPYLCKDVSQGGYERLTSLNNFKRTIPIKKLESKSFIGSIQIHLLEKGIGDGNFDVFDIYGLHVEAFPVIHGFPNQECMCFIFNQNIIYMSDVKRIGKEIWKYLLSRKESIELLILDNIYFMEHNTHLSYKEALQVVNELIPKRALFVGMSCLIGK